MKFKINRDLLPMKGHYFLFNAGLAPVQPFMPLIAKDLNFPSNAVGIINGVLPFTSMLAKPLFGAVADRFRLHKVIFISFQILTIIGFFNAQFVSKIDTDKGGEVKLVCGAETNFDVCYKNPSRDLNCLMGDIMKESYTNKTVKCSLRCDLSSDLRIELCGRWKADPKICSEDIASKTESTVAEYTHFTKDDNFSTAMPEYSLKKFSSTPLQDVKLEFVALVPMKHTLQVGDCMYFRVADAQLNDETHHFPYCEHEVDTKCKITCEQSKLSELLQQDNSNEDVNFVQYYQFWLFLFLSCLSWIGMAVVTSVADAVCFELLGEKGSQYGNQRVWGSIGWGLFAIIAGAVVDKFSQGEKANFTPVFYIMLVAIVCDVICSYDLKYEQTKVSSNIFRNVNKLLKDVYVDIFIVWCIVIGACVGVQWTFLFWHLDTLIASCDIQSNKKTLLGLVSGVQCFLGELPSFFLFGWIIKKIGHIHVMTIIPCIFGIRFVLYSILPNPWWVLPVELLQFSLGLTFATMASYASIVSPPGAEATVQGLVGSIFEGIGVSLGSYLGGLLIKLYGGAGLFRIFAVISFALSISHGAIQYLLSRNSKLQSQSKGFNGVAKYATPTEAVSMLEDT